MLLTYPFIPRKGYLITPIIIDINIIVFIVMMCSGLGFTNFNGGDLLNWGGIYRPLVLQGEYWRLLTGVFLHGGVMHLLFNMFGLLVVSIFLEPLLGSLKYFIGYVFTGIVASISSILWHPNTVSVGASGAIFGMYGLFLALIATNLFPRNLKTTFLISTIAFVGYNMYNGFAEGIDHAAHIGGLISGLGLGYIYFLTARRSPPSGRIKL
jgi:rhomboid protease GluP